MLGYSQTRSTAATTKSFGGALIPPLAPDPDTDQVLHPSPSPSLPTGARRSLRLDLFDDFEEEEASLRLDLFDDGGGSIGYCTAGDDGWESDPYLEEDELPGVEVEASADIEYDDEEEGVCYDDDLGDLMGLEPGLGLEVYESREDDGEESVYSVGLDENGELGEKFSCRKVF